MKVYGKNAVLEALRADLPVERIILAQGTRLPREIEALARQREIRVDVLDRKALNRMAHSTKHQGIIAVIGAYRYRPAEEILAQTVETRGVVLLLDGVEDPMNLGNIIRTAEVLGASGLILPERRSASVTQAVIKASAGAALHFPIARVNNLKNALRDFVREGGWVVAVEKGGQDIRTFSFPYPLALILGSEGRGVSRGLREMADAVVTIPMAGKVTSLNVGAAAAIALYEALRKKLPSVDSP